MFTELSKQEAIIIDAGGVLNGNPSVSDYLWYAACGAAAGSGPAGFVVGAIFAFIGFLLF